MSDNLKRVASHSRPQEKTAFTTAAFEEFTFVFEGRAPLVLVDTSNAQSDRSGKAVDKFEEFRFESEGRLPLILDESILDRSRNIIHSPHPSPGEGQGETLTRSKLHEAAPKADLDLASSIHALIKQAGYEAVAHAVAIQAPTEATERGLSEAKIVAASLRSARVKKHPKAAASEITSAVDASGSKRPKHVKSPVRIDVLPHGVTAWPNEPYATAPEKGRRDGIVLYLRRVLDSWFKQGIYVSREKIKEIGGGDARTAVKNHVSNKGLPPDILVLTDSEKIDATLILDPNIVYRDARIASTVSSRIRRKSRIPAQR